MSFQKLSGFSPDLDPSTPGIITDCDNLVPSEKGFRALEAPASTGLPALAAASLGAVVVRKLDDTTRFLAGTATKLYEGNVSAWTDVSSATYTGSARWSFSQFGNVTIATNKADSVQQSSSGAFANLTGSPPKASITETVTDFVFLFDTNDATYGDNPDGWWCSGLSNYTIWTPSVATQAARGRLTDTAGKIVGARSLGDDIIAYKARSIYRGVYQGPPIIWAWELISPVIGAANKESTVNIGNAHIFMGYDDFYIFDGSRPTPIPNPLRKWFFAQLSYRYQYLVYAMHDARAGLVFWWYPSTASTNGTLDMFIAYNYRTGQWGKGTRSVEACVEYLTGTITYDGLGTIWATYDDIPAIPYDSPFWTSLTPSPAIIDTTHTVQTLSGTPGTTQFTTGDYGSDGVVSFVSRVRPRYSTVPTTASMVHSYRDQEGNTLSSDSTVSASSGKFDVLRSARWHRDAFTFTGLTELSGLDVTIEADSLE